jgi:DNA-binding NarL/FixJ family response regulator
LPNLSHLPEEVIELIRGALRGQRFVAAEEALTVERSLPGGHVEAALLMVRRLELLRLLERQPSRERGSLWR